MPRVADLATAVDAVSPFALAESWDNVGLLVGDPDAEIRRVLLAIDALSPVVAEAASEGCDAIVAYHPTIFKGVTRLLAGSVAFELVRRGIAVVSPHTALDVAAGGTNDVLADAVGMLERAPLRPRPSGAGLGRVGPIAKTARVELIERIRRELGVERLLVAGPTTGDATRVAVGAGAGGEFVHDAIRAGADLYLTGEMRHHDANVAAEHGLTVVCALHSNSERKTLRRLRETLARALPDVTFVESARDRDPFAIL